LLRRDFLKLLGVAAVTSSAGAGVGYFIRGNEKSGSGTPWLGDTTEQNLKNAFAGESQANVRYTLFGNKAQVEGFGNVARLFAAITLAEQVHAGNHFTILGQLNEASITNSMAGFGPGNTAKNLALAIGGETFEIAEMYPAYKDKATQENAGAAVLSFSRAIEAEKSHLTLYNSAKAAVDSGKDMQVGKIYVCPVCGRVVGDDAPDFCPVCGTPKAQFKVF
jgi:rubrerythrin